MEPQVYPWLSIRRLLARGRPTSEILTLLEGGPPERGIAEFLAWSVRDGALCEDGRSPLRVALQLLGQQSMNDDAVRRCVEPMVRACRSRPWITLAVLLDPHTPAPLRSELLRVCSAHTHELVAASPRASSDVLDTLSQISSLAVRNAVSANPRTESRTLVALLEASELPPPESLFLPLLAGPPADQVIFNVAAHSHTPEGILDELCRHDDERVRRAAASNESLRVGEIERLVGDSSLAVRVRAARNATAPPELLRKLASDRDLHESLAKNPSTPADVLAALFREGSRLAREVAAHLALPESIARACFDHPDRPVRSLLGHYARFPDLLERMAREDDAGIRMAVARNESAPPDVLSRLAQDPVPGVRSDVAWNRSTPPSALEALADDEEPQVRKYVARNPTTPPAAQLLLAADPDQEVCFGLSRNPRATHAALHGVIARLPPEEPRPKLRGVTTIRFGPDRATEGTHLADHPAVCWEALLREPPASSGDWPRLLRV